MIRQRRRDQIARRFGIRADDPLCKNAIARSLGQRAHQIHDRIDETPRKVATQGCEQDRAYFAAPGCGDRQRANDRDRHDEAEQDLGNTIDGIEQPLPFARRCVIHHTPRRHDGHFCDRTGNDPNAARCAGEIMRDPRLGVRTKRSTIFIGRESYSNEPFRLLFDARRDGRG